MLENMNRIIKSVASLLIASLAVAVPATVLYETVYNVFTDREKTELGIPSEGVGRIQYEFSSTQSETVYMGTQTLTYTEYEANELETAIDIEELRSELADILENKTFDSEMKQLVLDAFDLAGNNYDDILAYNKISKPDFLHLINQLIKNDLHILEYVDKDDPQYEEKVGVQGIIATTHDDGSIYMARNCEQGRDAENLLHEIIHLNNLKIQTSYLNAGTDLTHFIREGQSARAEDFGDDNTYGYEKRAMIFSDVNNKVYMPIEYFENISGAKSYTVYSVYENMYERLEMLIGMDKLIKFAGSSGDFAKKVLSELAQNYGEQNAKEFMKYFMAVLMYTKIDGFNMTDIDYRELLLLSRIEDDKNVVNASSQKNELNELYKKKYELIGKLEDCTQIREQIEQGLYDDELAKSMEKSITTIEYVNNNYLCLTEDRINNFNYDDLLDELSYEIEVCEYQLEIIYDYKNRGELALIYPLASLEEWYGRLVKERIKRIDNINDLNIEKALSEHYVNQVQFDITIAGYNMDCNYMENVTMPLEALESELMG